MNGAPELVKQSGGKTEQQHDAEPATVKAVSMIAEKALRRRLPEAQKGFSRPPNQCPMGSHLHAFPSRLVYGATADAVRHAVRAAL